MCAGAMVQSRMNRVVYGVADPKGGAAGSAVNLLQFPTFNHRCDIEAGVRHDECLQLLRQFFLEKRTSADEARGGPEFQA